MKVDFERLHWENFPSTDTPLNADNLNRLEEGVAGLYSDVSEIQEELGGGVGEYVTEWLDEHVTPGGSTIVVDDTLSITGAAADAKKTGDEISDLKDGLTAVESDVTDLKEDLEQLETDTLTEDAKKALLACFEHVTWDGDDGQDYINDLASALNMLELKGLTINKTSAEIRMSHTETLIATKIPSSAVGNITWASSDDSVASVSNDGVVTPVAMGSATITASCGDFSASCSVTVMRPFALLTGVHEFEDGSKIEISNGNHIKLTFAKTGEQQVCLTTLDGNVSEDMTRAHNSGCTQSLVTIFSLSNSTLETTLTKTSDASLNYNCSIYAQPTGVGTNGFDLIGSNMNTATKTATVTGKTGDICNIGMWMKNAVIGAVYEADLEIICDGVRVL